MSYLVLARKYRPKTFSEMVGQEHVVQALSNALTSQRLHHAYLFTGTRGVGKTTVSRILAKSLNCLGADGQGGITASPCGVCEACVAIDAGRFVDYTELDAASNRGVDEVQQLLEQAVYKPVQGRFKVFMIDEVHMLSNTAFNAMLKTLEEPPEYLKFVLATTDPQKVPVTVLSRCLQFNLRPMAPETVRAHLETILAAEGIAREPAALRLLAKYAHGSMRDGLSLTDQAIAFGDGALKEAQVRDMLGAIDDAYIYQLIESLARGDGAAVIDVVRGMQAQGLSAASALEQMTDVLHRMQVAQITRHEPQDERDEGGEEGEGGDAPASLASLANQMPADEIQLLYSICLHGMSDLGLASDEYAALTMILLRLLAFKPRGGAAEPAKKPSPALHTTVAVPLRVQPEPLPDSKTERLVDLPPVAVASPTAAVAAALAVADSQFQTTDLGDQWNSLVEQLIQGGQISGLLRELALQSELMALGDQACILQVDNEMLASTANTEKLAQALKNVGVSAELTVQTGPVSDTPALRAAHWLAARQAEAESSILNDPQLQQLMREFDGKIVPGSIKPLPTNASTIPPYPI